MDYRDYRKKYGSASQPQKSGNNSGFADRKPADAARQHPAVFANESATGSVTRHFTTGKKNNRRGTQSRNSASAKIVLTAIVALTFFLILMTVLLIVTSDTVWLPDYIAPKAILEAGTVSKLNASDFLVGGDHVAEFSDDTEYSLNHVGTYRIKLVIDGEKTYTTKLQVLDTVVPSASAANVTVRIGSVPKPELCVADIVDATNVTVSYRKKPDLSELGTYRVELLLKDEGGNEAVVESTIIVVEDAAILNDFITIEAGSKIPDVSVFVGVDGDGEYYSDIASQIDTSVPGLYSPEIIVRGTRYLVTIEVRDTVAPTAVVTPKVIYNDGDFPDPSKFVSKISDATQVEVSWAVTPVKTGKYPIDVKIKLTDRGGNTTVYDTYVTSSTDHTPPTITVLNDTIEFAVGEAYSWRNNIQVSDNSGETPDVSLDISKADILNPGIYYVSYVAVDPAGNETRKNATMIVHDNIFTDEQLSEACAEICSRILADNMSLIQKINAIYTYLHNNTTGVVHYADNSAHDDWKREAWLTFTSRNTGDCFAFASCAKALLQHIGLETVMVERAEYARQHGTHFWLMVNIGTDDTPLWYHFDATPMAWKFRAGDTYLLTTAQLRAYNQWRNDTANDPTENYYVYDEDMYPKSASTVIVNLPGIPVSYYQ